MAEREPDWDTVMESRAEMERDANACPECHGKGAIERNACTCGAGPGSYLGMHERYCGLEPCPAGCPFVPPSMTEAPY